MFDRVICKGSACLKNPDKGLILRYLERTSDCSRQQMTRRFGRWCEGWSLCKRYRAPKHGWMRKFAGNDVVVFAETDALHNTLSGPATAHPMPRVLENYGNTRQERQVMISAGSLYNLCKARGYPTPDLQPFTDSIKTNRSDSSFVGID